MTTRCRSGHCLLCLDCRARALYAWEARIELLTELEDLQHELRLARRHLDTCPTALTVADHDSDKARENA